MIVIGIGEASWSYDTMQVLRTYALGSCVGVTAYDPNCGIGGLLHFQLPKGSGPDVDARPYRYGNVGLPRFLNSLFQKGAHPSSLQLTLSGGADISDEGGHFGIGRLNVQLAVQLLRKNRLMWVAEDLQGHIPRTLSLHMDSGRVTVSTGLKTTILWQGGALLKHTDGEERL
jgi:chemotaxis protein CheD